MLQYNVPRPALKPRLGTYNVEVRLERANEFGMRLQSRREIPCACVPISKLKVSHPLISLCGQLVGCPPSGSKSERQMRVASCIEERISATTLQQIRQNIY